MKRITLLAAIFASSILPDSQAGERGTGIGLIIGEPASGLSIKQWINDVYAVDAALAWSFERDSAVYLHANFLAHDFQAVYLGSGYWPLFAGAGLRLKLDEEKRLDGGGVRTDTHVGIRLVFGLAHVFDRQPLDIFVEVAPTLDLAPSARFDIHGAIGIRYYFP